MTQAATEQDHSERYRKRFRIRKRSEYLALQRGGKRRRSEHFTVITRERKCEPSRLGITASKKVGNAPVRNRVRRLVREFFRRNRAAMASPRDILVIAQPGIDTIAYDSVERELRSVLQS